MTGPSQGYLLIADITGYTQYLSSSELEHAQGVLQTLMELLIDHTKPPLVIAQLEGDAVFSYGMLDGALRGQTFVEMIENTYVSFRSAIDLMVLNTSCDCNACANIGALDLKFFVHHGTFTLHRLNQRDEVVGPDVITVHRLAKNTVTEATGIRAYTLYTSAAITALGLDGLTDGLVRHAEHYEHLGKIEMWVQDMQPVWESKKDSLRIRLDDGDVLVRVSDVLPATAAEAWDMITNPHYRAMFLNSVEQKTLDRRNGRMAAGSSYECFHGGSRVTLQTILDWHPFEQMTTEDTTPVPRATVLIQFRLAPADSGTTIEVLASRARGPLLSRWICNAAVRTIVRRNLTRGLATLRREVAEQAPDGAVDTSPPTPIDGSEVAASISQSLRGRRD